MRVVYRSYRHTGRRSGQRTPISTTIHRDDCRVLNRKPGLHLRVDVGEYDIAEDEARRILTRDDALKGDVKRNYLAMPCLVCATHLLIDNEPEGAT